MGMLESVRRKVINVGARYVYAPAKLSVPYVVLGSSYGGWPLIPALTSLKSIIYSFGLGDDISFDVAAIERFGCDVYGFDPTPRSIQWLRSQTLPSQFHLSEIGLAAQPGELSLQPPKLAKHVSYSTSVDTSANENCVLVPVLDLRTIMKKMGHTHVDVLKMDVEGSEYPVIEGLWQQEVLPAQLMVEFHHGMYGHTLRQTRNALETLAKLGYRAYWISRGREYGFVRGDVN